MKNQHGNHLYGVQLLRGLAALLVVVGHALAEADQMLDGGYPRWSFPWGIGVDIFFVISGFIMAYTSRGLFEQKGAPLEFMKRRIIRIVPLYYIFTALMVVAIVVRPDQLNSAAFSLERLVASLLFIPVEDARGSFRPILSLGWTLNYEIFFYVLFAGLIWLPRRYALTILTIALSLIVLVIGRFGAETPALRFWSDPIILEFCMGAVLGWIYSVEDSERRWLGLSILCLTIAYYFLAWPFGEPNRISTLGIIAILALYLAVWHWPYNNDGPFYIFSIIGDCSYSLYLSHPFALAVVKIIYERSMISKNGTLFVIIGVLVSIITAVLVYRFIENPLIQAGKKMKWSRIKDRA